MLKKKEKENYTYVYILVSKKIISKILENANLLALTDCK